MSMVSVFVRSVLIGGCVTMFGGWGCSEPADGSGRSPAGLTEGHDARGEDGACEPLAAKEQATVLGSIIAAGRAADGTFYVADRERADSGEERVFVSEGETLVRRRVLGGGSTSSGQRTEYSWLFESGDREHRLFAQLEGSRVTSLAAAPDHGERLREDYGTVTQLSLVDESTVRAMMVRNLPGEIVVEYLSRVEDGTLLLVTRPRDDWRYEDFRLFWGREPELVEREIRGSVLRGRDGGTTRIEFGADGKHYTVVFPSLLSQPGSSPTLSTDAETWSMTREDVAAVPQGTSFVCL